MGFAPYSCLWFREKHPSNPLPVLSKTQRKKESLLIPHFKKNIHRKSSSFRSTKNRRGFLIVPSSSSFVFAPVAPGSPPEGLFLFMASHSTSMFPINVSTALLNASFGRWSLGDLGDFPSDLEEKPGKQHCYENDHI